METFRYKVEVRDAAPRVKLEGKWGVAGQTGRRDSEPGVIHVEVAHAPTADQDIIAAAFGHECGHGDQFNEDKHLSPATLTGPQHFDIEVEAWERWHDQRGTGITETEGQLILDCLTTYRRGLADITDEMWDDARERVESWVEPEGALDDYVPLEPDPDDVPLCAAGRMVLIEQRQPDDDGDDEGNDNNEEGDDGGSAGKDDPPLDEDDDDDPLAGLPPLERPQQDEPKPEDEPDLAELLRERDSWLASNAGQAAAAAGLPYLTEQLERSGWPAVLLPPVTRALLDLPYNEEA